MNINITKYQSINVNDEQEQDDDFHKISPASMKNRHGLLHDGKIKTSACNSAYIEDHLVPPYDSDERPSNLFVGTFNLMATIIGGGALSLPIVFEKCGIAFTTIAMLLSAYMTYMSLIMLCYCSRRGGGSSYGEVVRSAFGERMEEVVSCLLCIYLMLSIVAYMVLCRDVWTPLAQELFDIDMNGDYVLLAIVGMMLPFLFQRSLHALRKICYIGFASTSVLCIALCRGGFDKMKSSDGFNKEINVFKIPSPQELLFSFPIICCAFLCHFNIISIQNALQKPTRKRMQNLTQYAMGACFLLMYMFGLGGYMYAGRNTEGNILLNVSMAKPEDSGYYLFMLGRIGCGITICIAMPMNLLPARDSLLEVIDVWYHRSHHRSDAISTHEEEQCCWRFLHTYNSAECAHDAEITTEDEMFEWAHKDHHHQIEGIDEEWNTSQVSATSLRTSAILIRQEPIQSDYIFRNTLTHYGSTLLMTNFCYLGAVAVSGVATVWSFIGSSMAFFIAFILPCGCFIVIESAVPTTVEGGDRHEKWIKLAWAILVFSVLGAIVCTVNNTVGFS